MADTEQKKLKSSKKLKMLVTIVHKEKIDFFVDLLQGFDANLQLISIGNGTTKATVFTDEVGTKGVIFSILTEDRLPKVLSMLEDKFSKLRGGKGVAFAVPLSSVMGVTFFNFLSNNRSSFD